MNKLFFASLFAACFSFCWFQLANAQDLYRVGVGIADVTGPAAEINMMGYAHPEQVSAGIHMRQYSRAFIIDDGPTKVVFVNVDCGMIDQIIKTEVSDRLKANPKYAGMYTGKNVVLSGTHTHSGPAGFMQYLLFDITSKGWVQQSFDSLVDGILLSIDRAHDNVKDANIYYSKDILVDANINRSPAAYLNNPASERAKYAYNTDKDMFLLKIVDAANGKPMGVIAWYAVHLTSMNNTNPYISSDNKGYAQFLFEEEMNGADVMPGKGSFVAAFGASNLGDVSPNIQGAKCIDTGLPCDFLTSTCNGKAQLCIGFGPGKDMFDSTRIIGERQFKKAWSMYNKELSTMEPLEGPIQFVHQFVDMPEYNVQVPDSVSGELTTMKLCKPALGYSFASGCTDGTGAFNFSQGTDSENPFWNMVAGFLAEPTEEQKARHSPKPILLDTGDISQPYLWHPMIVETQMLRIGQVFILAVPAEFTTMAGRRLRESINQVASSTSGGPSNAKTIIAGLSNVYTHYVTTFEEYQVQRYEAASVIYGPHTLVAYIDQYSKLTRAMIGNEDLDDGPQPPNLLNDQISLVAGVVFDKAPFGRDFGDVLVEPYPYVTRNETVYATFVSGHPRNNLMTERTFMTVEQEQSDKSWKVIRTDSHFDTVFAWERTTGSQSQVHTRWTVPSTAVNGNYRFNHYGYYKNIDGSIVEYSGTTKTFAIGGM